MSEDVEHVAGERIYHWQSVDAVVDQRLDRIVQRRIWTNADQWHDRLLQHTAPRVQLVLLQLVHRRIGRRVVHLQDLDKVRNGQHAHEDLLLRVPERSSAHSIVNQSVEGLLHQQLRVEDDQLGRGGDQVVALVEPEELDEYLRFILFCGMDKNERERETKKS